MLLRKKIMKVAAIDIGTNSTRLLIAEGNDCNIRELGKYGTVTRLGKGLKGSGKLSDESISKTIDVLKKFREIIEKQKIDKVIAVATEAARIANNIETFIQKAKDIGFNIEVLSSKKEAELVFKANIIGFKPNGKAMSVDLGGGSTEIVFGSMGKIEYLNSLKFGVVSLLERFIQSDPPTRDDLNAMESFILEKLKVVKERIDDENFPVYVVGGTITSVVAMEKRMQVYSSRLVHGYRVKRETIEKWYRKLCSMELSERKSIVGLEKNRADVIIPGLAFFKVFCSVFNRKNLIVSEYGLLYGLVMKEIGCIRG